MYTAAWESEVFATFFFGGEGGRGIQEKNCIICYLNAKSEVAIMTDRQWILAKFHKIDSSLLEKLSRRHSNSAGERLGISISGYAGRNTRWRKVVLLLLLLLLLFSSKIAIVIVYWQTHFPDHQKACFRHFMHVLKFKLLQSKIYVCVKFR